MSVVETFKIGDQVETVTVPNPPTDWTVEAKRARKFGVRGEVVEVHTGHGICFSVRHDDGTVGAYEPRELRKPDDRKPFDPLW